MLFSHSRMFITLKIHSIILNVHHFKGSIKMYISKVCLQIYIANGQKMELLSLILFSYRYLNKINTYHNKSLEFLVQKIFKKFVIVHNIRSIIFLFLIMVLINTYILLSKKSIKMTDRYFL